MCYVNVKPNQLSSHHGLARAIVALAATGCAALIVACGSSRAPGGTSGRSSSFVPFAACMRSHAVPNFPDPGSGPGGGVEIVPPGINTSAPAFETAWSDCSKLLPVSGAHHPPSAQMVDQMLQFSRCMRAHGVTGFPDPTTTQLTPQSGYFTIRSGGVYLAIPETINRVSPTYQQAARACRFGPGFS
jgi:hypothetical protein